MESFLWRRRKGAKAPGDVKQVLGLEGAPLPPDYTLSSPATAGSPATAPCVSAEPPVPAPGEVEAAGGSTAGGLLSAPFEQISSAIAGVWGRADVEETVADAEDESQGVWSFSARQRLRQQEKRQQEKRQLAEAQAVGEGGHVQQHASSSQAELRAARVQERARNGEQLSAVRDRFRSALTYSLDEDLVKEQQARRRLQLQQPPAAAAAAAPVFAAAADAAADAQAAAEASQEVAAVGRMAKTPWAGETAPVGYWDDDDYRVVDDDRVNPVNLDEPTRRKWLHFVRESKLLQNRSWWDPQYEADNQPLPDTYFDLNK